MMKITGQKGRFVTIAEVALDIAEKRYRELDAIEQELEAGRDANALAALRLYFQRRKQPHREKANHDRENEVEARA